MLRVFVGNYYLFTHAGHFINKYNTHRPTDSDQFKYIPCDGRVAGIGGVSSFDISMGASPASMSALIFGGGGAGGTWPTGKVSFICIHCCAKVAQSTKTNSIVILRPTKVLKIIFLVLFIVYNLLSMDAVFIHIVHTVAELHRVIRYKKYLKQTIVKLK